jgi:hypothetical protein
MSKYAGLAQENGFGLAQLHTLLFQIRVGKSISRGAQFVHMTIG